MSNSEEGLDKIVLAHLNFLTIYNPSLGNNDETQHEQILYYYDSTARHHRNHEDRNAASNQNDVKEAANEHLRQIGLAQGMVEFARSFCNDGSIDSVDSVETDKHRLVLSELESGWWILACINLTRIPSSNRSLNSNDASTSPQSIEHSSRDVSPPALLRQQLHRAHRIFLLHHSPTINDLFVRLPRARFCNLLDNFWSHFVQNWDVLLHGNPTVDVYGGVKLAAGGELGMGVGEEEWGSGDREVLEGLVRNTAGLIDLTVSRFGEPAIKDESKENAVLPKAQNQEEPGTARSWLGDFQHAGPADGLVFSGVGAITRESLRSLSEWTQWIYAYGTNAYGVTDNPNSTRPVRRKRRLSRENYARTEPPEVTSLLDNDDQNRSLDHRADAETVGQSQSQQERNPPLISAVEAPMTKPTVPAITSKDNDNGRNDSATYPLADPEMWMKVFTLGYGTAWGGYSRKAKSDRSESGHAEAISEPEQLQKIRTTSSIKSPSKDTGSTAGGKIEAPATIGTESEPSGHFIIGLLGDMEQLWSSSTDNTSEDDGWGGRLSLRTVHVETTSQRFVEDDDDNESTITPGGVTEGAGITSPCNSYSHVRHTRKLRVVVYVHQPFVFTLLFEPSTSALSIPSYFHTLYRVFSPLHHSLLNSTSPANVAARLNTAHAMNSKTKSTANSPIFDLIYDPTNLTVHTSIPNIPQPGALGHEVNPTATWTTTPPPQPWNRSEAINVHSQILNTYSETRGTPRERERTAKTSRGWWVVWMRMSTTASLQSSGHAGQATDEGFKEAILIRRASDSVAPKKSGGEGALGFGMMNLGMGMGSWGRRESVNTIGTAQTAGAGWSPARMAEGIGVDARRYVESLLSLSR